MFITFEGLDGSGKTTQIRRIAEQLRQNGYDVLLTREPGGTAIGDQIREVLHSMKNTDMHPRTELLLYCASRAQLVEAVLKPHLESGGIVICDRFYDSTLAYQGYGHGLDLDTLRTILSFATGGLKPDLTVYLDLSPEDGLRRRQAAVFSGAEWNRMDDMALAFHERVRAGYNALIAAEPERWQCIDAGRSEDEVNADIVRVLEARLKSTPA